MVNIIALGIVLILVLIFIIIGISMINTKDKPIQYLSNTKKLPNVKDIRGYNKAIGKIFTIFALLLLPILSPVVLFVQNSKYSFLSILLMPFWVIGLIISCVFTEGKYKK
ncbi:hypothetical protein [Anaerofustis stercorihominis]|uniref:hypothetical protein n=1 Tax=Anaerofustis stercorihominis TaxID=214853 RepID=UPI00110634F3|nr:hypothetical protein [Anaerofustis stercorihominis]